MLITFLAVVIIDLLVIFAVVWLWSMWVAFTQGDDVIAKFGRWVMGNTQQGLQRIWDMFCEIWKYALKE